MNARSCVTAAIIISVATAQSRKPPRKSSGLPPDGLISHIHHTIAARISNPSSATPSSSRPLVLSGPRITATGRQTMANAAPRRRPAARREGPQIRPVELRDLPSEHVPVRVGCDLRRSDRTGGVDHCRHDRDHEGGDDEPSADVGDLAGSAAEECEHHQRPDHVELLFDGKAPEVTQRGELVRGGVPSSGPDLVPVRHVEQSGDHIAAEFAERVAIEDGRPDRQCDQHREERREQATSSPVPELAHVDRVRALLLRDQEQRDQIARDDEEHLDTEIAAGEPVGVGVVDHHRNHRQGAHAVETWQVRDPTDLRRRRSPCGPRRRPRGGSRRCARGVGGCSHVVTSIAQAVVSPRFRQISTTDSGRLSV